MSLSLTMDFNISQHDLFSSSFLQEFLQSSPPLAITASQLEDGQQNDDRLNNDIFDSTFFQDIPQSSSPLAITPSHLEDDQQDDDSLSNTSGDDDGLYNNALSNLPRDDYSEDSSEGEEQVMIAEDQYLWKIDHSRGDHRLKGMVTCNRLRKS